MRGAAIVVLLVASTAAAHKVVREPPLVRTCPEAKTWAQIEKCAAQEGAVTIERALPNAKLVRVVLDPGAEELDLGVFLYVQDKKGWHIAGLYEGHAGRLAMGGRYVVTDLAPLAIKNHTGYQFDITWWEPGVRTLRMSVLCSGADYRCSTAITRCDQMEHGKVIETFQGTLEITGPSEAHVAGDDSHAGDHCGPTRRVILDWPEY